MNITQIMDINAKKFGSQDCLRAGGTSWTFLETKEQAERVAAVLQSMGIKKGDKVAIMSQNTPAFVFTFYGILKAGGDCDAYQPQTRSPGS